MLPVLVLIILISRSYAVEVSSGPKDLLDTTSNALVITNDTTDGFCIAASGKSVPMFISSSDYPGVIRAFRDLQRDITVVTGAEPTLNMDTIPPER